MLWWFCKNLSKCPPSSSSLYDQERRIPLSLPVSPDTLISTESDILIEPSKLLDTSYKVKVVKLPSFSKMILTNSCTINALEKIPYSFSLTFCILYLLKVSSSIIQVTNSLMYRLSLAYLRPSPIFSTEYHISALAAIRMTLSILLILYHIITLWFTSSCLSMHSNIADINYSWAARHPHKVIN